MRQESYDTAAYENWLKDEKRTEDEVQQCKMLDAYFSSRENLPGKSLTGEDLVPEPKTSTEICDDLEDMYYVSNSIIAKWMQLHGFGYTTVEDGTVKWAIWRNMKPLV